MFQDKADKPASMIPLDLLSAALRIWWIFVLGIAVGALLGFFAHRLLPPVYQAQSVISVNIDFSHTGKLTDVEEDFMVQVIGRVIGSEDVIADALVSARTQGYNLDRETFDKIGSVQRRFTDWLLIVRHPDPADAAVLANNWGNAAWEMLQEAYVHTLKAEQLQNYLDAQTACLEGIQSSESVPEACSLQTADEVRAEIQSSADMLAEEKMAARGIAPGTMLVYSQPAQAPSQPIMRGRNSLVLSGGLIGLLLTVVFVAILKPEKLRK